MSNKRTPRACERCRRARRKCEPPHPCTACLLAGVRCEVRVKPRPKRTSARGKTLSNTTRDGEITSNIASGVANSTTAQTKIVSTVCREPLYRSGGTFEKVHELVRRLLKDECGYELQCQLPEPNLKNLSRSFLRLSDSPLSQTPELLNHRLVETLLAAFERFNNADLVDPEDLLQTGRSITSVASFPSDVDQFANSIETSSVPPDKSSLLWSAFAVGALLLGRPGYGRLCFEISTQLAERFVGSPSFDLCLAYFLQHAYLLRTGTSTHARAVVAQTVQACHDLKLCHGSHGVRGLHLYLLVYITDQYSALTYDTSPVIHAAMLPDQAFAPLAAARPQLRPLIDLVSMNGQVIEHCYRNTDLNDTSLAETMKLEAMIGAVRLRRQSALSDNWLCKSFTEICEPIARIHMLCCRIQLRAPGLSNPETWMSSISICVHAAAGILSTYFQLYLPALRTLAQQQPGSDSCKITTHVLPPTWRQVKRIMLCVLLITLAYWRGELAHDEASRHLAMARLALEYPRSRWDESLREALMVISDISRIAEFHLDEYTRVLLPAAETPGFPLPLDSNNSSSEGTSACTPDAPGTSPFLDFNSIATDLSFWHPSEEPIEGLGPFQDDLLVM